MLLQNNTAPQAFITINKNRVKQFGNKVYLSDKTNFEIELFNPTQFKYGVKFKMNGKYIFRMLIEDKKGFEQLLYNTTISYSSILARKQSVFQDIISFLSNVIIDFNASWQKMRQDKYLVVKYDVLQWRQSGYSKVLKELFNSSGIKLRFYLPEKRSKALKKLLEQYRHPNKNVTLRKMSEYMPVKDFFYEAERV